VVVDAGDTAESWLAMLFWFVRLDIAARFSPAVLAASPCNCFHRRMLLPFTRCTGSLEESAPAHAGDRSMKQLPKLTVYS
jgi:hypothetical protein